MAIIQGISLTRRKGGGELLKLWGDAQEIEAVTDPKGPRPE